MPYQKPRTEAWGRGGEDRMAEPQREHLSAPKMLTLSGFDHPWRPSQMQMGGGMNAPDTVLS